MISTDNIRMEKSETKFYAPPYFKQNILLLLTRNNIPCYVIKLESLQHDRASYTDRKMWATRFSTLQHNETRNVSADPDLMDCIVSHCNPDDLFDIAKRMTGPNMDTDFKNMKLLMQHEIEQEYCERYHTTLND